MSVGYVAVGWSRHKRVYDLVVAAAIAVFIGLFVLVSKLVLTGEHAVSDEVLIIRATGACAMTLLTVILCIGPLARIVPGLGPVLYNRRHLGVMTFLVALIHAAVVVGYYHGFAVLSPLRSLLVTITNPDTLTSWSAFPFELPGVIAFIVLFFMAATSHDFWLKNLSHATWKRLHMLVYVAFSLLVGHVALGTMQSQNRMPSDELTRWIVASLLVFAVSLVSGLHLLAGLREVRKDRGDTLVPQSPESVGERWIDAGSLDTLPESRARTVCASHEKGMAGNTDHVRERIAVYKHKGEVFAVENVCAHQGGPLGEGKIIDGCITCPWHGWQYRPEDGKSPPPFTEQIATYQVRVVSGRIQVKVSKAEAALQDGGCA